MVPSIKILIENNVIKITSDHFGCKLPAKPLKQIINNYHTKKDPLPPLFEYYNEKLTCCYDENREKYTIFTIKDDALFVHVYDSFDIDDVAEYVFNKVKHDLKKYFGALEYEMLSKKYKYWHTYIIKTGIFYGNSYEYGSPIDKMIVSRGKHKAFSSSLKDDLVAKTLYKKFEPKYSFKIPLDALTTIE